MLRHNRSFGLPCLITYSLICYTLEMAMGDLIQWCQNEEDCIHTQGIWGSFGGAFEMHF